jgi:hypothetical protein
VSVLFFTVEQKYPGNSSGHIRVCEDDDASIEMFLQNVRNVLCGYDKKTVVQFESKEIDAETGSPVVRISVESLSFDAKFVSLVVKNCAAVVELRATAI